MRHSLMNIKIKDHFTSMNNLWIHWKKITIKIFKKIIFESEKYIAPDFAFFSSVPKFVPWAQKGHFITQNFLLYSVGMIDQLMNMKVQTQNNKKYINFLSNTF